MGRRKMWWPMVVPCTMMTSSNSSSSMRRSLRTESVKDIEEILKAKLATVKEEEDQDDELAGAAAAVEERCLKRPSPSLLRRLRRLPKKGKTAKIRSKTMMGRLFLSHFIISLKQVSLWEADPKCS